jgi:hypothetical protein
MKNKIIEICELGQPQSIIQRENEPITELIKTDSLIEELNQQLLLYNVVGRSEHLKCGNQRPPCSPNLKFGMLECCDCDWSE